METIQHTSLQRRLTAYSTLAAAGACSIAAAPKAEASVVSSGPLSDSVTVSALGSYFNLTTFAFGSSFSAVSGGDTTAPVLNLWGTTASYSYLYPSSTTINRFVATTAASNIVLELTGGSVVGPGSNYTTSRTGATGGPVTNGGWVGGTTGYFGVKFLSGTTTDYGWVEAFLPTTPTAANPIEILGAAYENTGAAITIPNAVPEPGTVGALAMGALGSGAVAWRRRRKATRH